MKKIRQKEAKFIILIITWPGIGLCGYWSLNSYIDVFIILIMNIRIGKSGVQRPICDYIFLPVVFTKFMYAVNHVNHG